MIKVNKKISSIILLIGIISVVLLVLYINLEKFPKLYKTYSYYHFSLLAKRFPPSSENYKRLKAMAQAAKEGKNTYTYETSKFPGPPLSQQQNAAQNTNETK